MHSCARSCVFTKFVMCDSKMTILVKSTQNTQKLHRNAVACSTSPLAVTRLTVYRQLHIMRTGRDSPPWEPKLCVASGCFNRDVLGIQPSDLHQIAREPTRGVRQVSARSSGAVRQGPVDVPGLKIAR